MSDIAERRKLEAELLEAQEGLNDTYYNHAKDQQNKALDDEITSYQDAKDDYLETLRDTLEDTKTIINEKIQEVLTNADIVLNGINTAAGEHSITLSGALTQPWNDASTVALAFKASLDENLPLLTNEDGVITSFSNTTKQLLEQAFGAGSTACKSFKTTVQADVAAIKAVVSNSTSPLTAQLKFPWNTMTGDDSPITTFSTMVRNALNNALSDAKNKAKDMKTNLTSPWTAGVNSINTWSEGVESALKNAQSQAKTAAEAIKKSLDIKVPSYTGGSSGSGSGNGNGSGGGGGNPTSSYTVTAELSTSLQKFKKQGSGPTKEHATMVAKQEVINAAHSFYRSKGYSDEKIFNLQKTWEKNIEYYAKGTTGTTKDQWAVTDEIGDELVLIPGKDGNLQYMRKGTSVIPADISKNLIEWGKITPNMEGLSSAIQGVNLMTNVINKPEVNLSFEALVKAEHITEETLPAVKKLVTQELDNFARKLNYSLKKFS